MNNELKSQIAEYIEKLKNEDEEIQKKYPVDIPNKYCNKAIITGLLIDNSFNPIVGDYINFFEVESEKSYIWTPKEDEYSVFVVEVDDKVKSEKCWVTLGLIIELSRYLITIFENSNIDNLFDYKWAYYFDHKNNIDNTTFYGMKLDGPSKIDLIQFSSGIVLKLTDIAEFAHYIELLYRDEKAFTATINLKTSLALNYCCLICETGKVSYHSHLAKEPEIWEHIAIIPKMESAIVQACRSAESLLGEPPKNRNLRKVYEFKENWRKTLNFDPDSYFEKGECSYFDFYYKLFSELRNPSAHSRGNIQYTLLKKNTVASQCFASKILYQYLSMNILDNSVALEKLSFNKDLLSRVSEIMSTKITKRKN